MKKVFAILLATLMLISMLAGCGSTAAGSTASSVAASTPASEAGAADAAQAADITLWTYPIGSWKDAATVDGIIAEFNKVYPEITVKVEYLDYSTGDDQVTAAIEAGTTPDIIMEGPERLVANWGAKGKMVDLKDLWTPEALKDIGATSAAVVAACTGADGAYYEYPLCMTTHCMAINYEVFEKADALQYLDLENRTWTTENFEKALTA
ncbi:MAG: ABC transporter substrate-binding protein, partial [Oscillospiraceae bacterium]|nr:ABC transporter substrate-binding protein [Oscillospiraceae bacterium]